eukprot:Gregarina_sp_Poly_1__11203@NODE_919_length_5716_cov_103_478315_g84_i3_p1_GENE_NODE_919_length_5716_cov_103_478315_g84_i3NODE_919_length_5716_cov_103_478315_g84_i3_p1_ORF_typecomplete_len1236_score198_17MIF4G_like_2/PF09090_11/3e03MIF4G_like_2/PF09090_11/0_00039MIF4G_like/PF09088_11/6_3e02MIF4G_like/PF09088_11/0_42MIF4G_like/PF09088_11/1_6e03MIF4G_like/PF09088_11/8_8e03_NODE_919_length_5716_cov_103_478315_g84_i32013710
MNDDRHDIKNRLVKLGDTTDRLLGPVLDVTRMVDAFVAADFFSWSQPRVQLSAEDEVLKIEELSCSELLRRTVFSACSSAGPNSDYFSAVLVDCVLQLPHKHSYYSTMILLLLQESVKAAGGDLTKILQTAYGSEGLMKGEHVNVKGEAAHSDDGSPIETVRGEVKGESKGDMKVTAKLEQTDNEMSDISLSPNAIKKVLYFLNLFGYFMTQLKTAMEAVWNKQGGLHQFRKLTNGLRFACDLCNVTIIDPVQVLDFINEVLDACLSQVNEDSGVASRALVEHAALLAVRASFWLSRDVYTQHRVRFGQIKSKFSEIEQKRRIMSREEYVVAHPAFSFNVDGDFAQSPATAVDEMAHALICFNAYEERRWTSKVIPRLYDSPKLSELKANPLEVLAPFNIRMEVSVNHWFKYSFDDSFSFCGSSSDMTDNSPIQPVVLYQPPPICLRWRESPRTSAYFNLFTDELIIKLLAVEPLNTADAWFVKSYVESTIQSFYEDPDTCAESLMYIPVKHDQFTIILVETVFEVCLQPPNGPLVSKSSQKQSAVFLTQLIHRLCVLEKSLVPIVVRAFITLLDHADSWDELLANQLICFISQWLTYQDSYALEVMKAILNHEQLKLFIPRKEELMANVSPMKDEKPADIKPEFADKYIARIRTPLAEIGFLQTFQMRFMSNIVDRMNRVLYLDTFQKKVPDVLTYFVPPQIAVDEHCLFFKVDDRDIRSRDDIIKMKDLRMTDLPPLESFIIRQMLRLQISLEKDRNRILTELLLFLQSRKNKPLVASLHNIQAKMIEAMFFSHLEQGVKREFTKVKEHDEEDEETNRPVKRPRTSEGLSAAIKTESMDVEGTTVPNEHPNDDASRSAEPAVAEENSAPTRIKGEILDPDILEITEISTKEEPDSQLVSIEYIYIGTQPFWTEESLTKLLANSFVAAGSKTLSHFQKVIDLYGQLWTDWIRLICDGAVNPEARRKILFESSRTLVEAIIDAWCHSSVARLRFCFHQLLVANLIDPVDLFSILSISLREQEHSFFQTVIGDYVFWDLFDSSMGCIKSGPVFKEEVKVSQEDAVLADDPNRYTALFIVALDGCASSWTRILTTPTTNPGRKLSAALQVRRILRLIKLSAFFGPSFKDVVQRINQWNEEFPILQSTQLLPKLVDTARIFHNTFISATNPV